MKHIIRAIRVIAGIPFVSIGSAFYWLGEQVAGEKYARRANAVRSEMLYEKMNRAERRKFNK